MKAIAMTMCIGLGVDGRSCRAAGNICFTTAPH